MNAIPRRLSLVAAVALLAAACDLSSGRYEPPSRRLLRGFGETFALPAYAELEVRAGALETAASALCAAPSAEALAAARAAWWAARAPWKRSEVLAFGPYADEPLRLGVQIDFWPVRTDLVEAILAGTDPLTPARLKSLTPAEKGMPVVEYLLHAPGVDAGSFAPASRRCAYLAGVAGDLRARATALRAAWDPAGGNYLGALLDSGHGGAFTSLQGAVAEVVTDMGAMVERIRADKLGRPVGSTSGGTPQPDEAESAFSGRSLEDIRDDLAGVEALYFGDPAREDDALDAYLRDRGHDLGDAMRAALAASRAALAAIPEPLTRAVVEAPGTVNAAIEQLGVLQRLVQVDVANALAITPTFDENDGD